MTAHRPTMPPSGPAPERLVRLVAALAAAAVAGLAAVPAATAHEHDLELAGAWLRVIIPSRPAAGYFTLRNESDHTRTLVGASSPACGRVMLHLSETVGGADRMVMVKGVTVPARGTLEFAPHGYHLMCMKPSAGLKPGQDVPFTLRFKDGATVTGPFKVRGATGR